jgi:hypothetical protein
LHVLAKNGIVALLSQSIVVTLDSLLALSLHFILL